jgi:hypothetical protein
MAFQTGTPVDEPLLAAWMLTGFSGRDPDAYCKSRAEISQSVFSTVVCEA